MYLRDVVLVEDFAVVLWLGCHVHHFKRDVIELFMLDVELWDG